MLETDGSPVRSYFIQGSHPIDVQFQPTHRLYRPQRVGLLSEFSVNSMHLHFRQTVMSLYINHINANLGL